MSVENRGGVPAEPVGFIGLGQIGGPMARRLVDWPGGLFVCDALPAATEPFAAAGATVVDSAAGVGRSAQLVSVMVRDDEQVREVVGALLEVVRPGAVVAIHSTIRADTAEDLAAEAGRHGVAVVDAPVSGGAMGAGAGTLALLVGGDEAAVERCRGPFACFADLVVHFGPTGSGTRAKLARNLLHFVAFTAVTEAQRLAEAAGLDIVKLGEVVRHSDAVTGGPGAIMLRNTTAPTEPGDFWNVAFSHARALGEKDLTLALELGAELGVDLPMASYAPWQPRPGTRRAPRSRRGVTMTDEQPPSAGEPGSLRAAGLAKMSEVYGWDVSDGPGDFFGMTVEHLFGEIWTREGLSLRDRRLLLIGLLTGLGLDDVLGLQFDTTYRLEELSADELREIVIFLTHYAGWPQGAKLNSQVEEIIARQP